VRITTDFQAVKEISSDLGLSNDSVDMSGRLNWIDINLVYIFYLLTDLGEVIDAARQNH
jgi:hypothetical protein